jgi:hypothetical protein
MFFVFVTSGIADDQQLRPPNCPFCQSMNDAWWTGPLLAPSASTLPHGHFLIEPYLFDVIVEGRFDRDGTLRSTTNSHTFGSLTYINYGLTDRLTIGMLPTFSYMTVARGKDSSGVGIGDITLQAQHRLTQFHPGSWIPTTSFTVQETFPTGKYDQLGDRPSDGFGSGAYTTTLALYSQNYFWLPNHRILRTRFNVSRSFSSNVTVKDVSVYGTEAGFRGNAQPGGSWFVNAAWEYSVTRNWVLALDATYRHDDSTSVTGHNFLDRAAGKHARAIRSESGSSDAFGLAPAVEYNWNPKIGVILGVRIFPAGRNTTFSITPAVAVNMVY